MCYMYFLRYNDKGYWWVKSRDALMILTPPTH